jgi:hypothetical protein
MGIIVDNIILSGAQIQSVYINCTTKPLRIKKAIEVYFADDDDETKLFKKTFSITYHASIYGFNISEIEQDPCVLKTYLIKDEQHVFVTDNLFEIMDQVYDNVKSFYPNCLDS